MTAITYAQALVAGDAVAIEAAILADIFAQGADLTGYDDFSTPKAMVSEQARARVLEQQIRVRLAQCLNPATASEAGDDWLDQVLLGIFQEERIPATYAEITLLVSCSSGAGPYSLVAGDLLAESDAAVYFASTNAAAQSLAAGATSPPMPFVSRTIGSTGNAIPGSVTRLVVGKPGLSVSGVAITTAGRGKEGNAAYLARCLAKWGTLGAGGNLAAYDYWIPTGTPAITRWSVRDDNPAGPGTIWIYAADAAGPATSPGLAALTAFMRARKALGSGALTCFASPAHPMSFAAQLVTDGTNPNAAAQVSAQFLTFNALWPTGGLVDEAILRAVLRGLGLGTVEIPTATGAVETVNFGLPPVKGITGYTLGAITGALALGAGEVLVLAATVTQ